MNGSPNMDSDFLKEFVLIPYACLTVFNIERPKDILSIN